MNRNTDNKVGFILKCMAENVEGPYSAKSRILVAKQRAQKEGITGSIIKEIEKSIVIVAIHEGILPETARYEGKHVVVIQSQNEANSITYSTEAYGFVYFVKNSDIYKIGITENLLRRMKELNPDEILNSVRCSNYQEVERKMHAHFKEKRIPQTEYFRLDPAEVEQAHSLMTDLADFKGR
ncbi:bacteriophage-like DNA-binding domain-containing protein [Synechococcus sp. A15-62]|nr:bacteriophage-like DNA-binding domain-containing protein [Synechococcus sp. A15-62]